jgi:hypothetical protein
MGRITNLTHYARFLEIIFGRYVTTAEARHAAPTVFQASLREGNNTLSDDQQRQMAMISEGAIVVRLEIESFYVFAKSFYVFAKILPDQWSQFVAAWFGDLPARRFIGAAAS